MDQQPNAPTQSALPLGVEPIEDHGIDMQTLIQDFRLAKQTADNITVDFPALDQIADGIPVTTDDGNPYVGDTTIAGLTRQIPRESVQQLPIFAAVINGTKHSIPAFVVSYFLRKAVFNEDTFGKGLLSTLQIGGEEALKHGFAAFICTAGMMYDEFGTTMKLIHYSNVAPEPGITDASEAGVWYVVADLTKSRVQKIRDMAAENENTTWIVEALDRLLETPPAVNNYSIYQSDARKKVAQQAPTYQFVTAYKVGKNENFITFCPQIEDTPLRVLRNKSKFGFPRVNLLVIDPAPLSWAGISRVRLASPNQNLLNAYYQNIGKTMLYNSDPALLKRGRFTKPVQLKRKAVWETVDQNATVELKAMNEGALAQFSQMSQTISSQIQNIMGKPIKNTDLGNTSPGAKQQIKYEDSSTNQVTNIMENFLRQYALVAVDTYIAEQTIDDNVDPETGETIPNEDTIIIDDEAKNAINRLIQAENDKAQADYQRALEAVDPNDPTAEQPEAPELKPLIGDDNKFTIDWNEFYDAIQTMSVEIELSLGKDELEEKTRGDLQDTLVTMTQNADPNDLEKKQKIANIEDRLIEKMVPETKRDIQPTSPRPPEPPVESQRGDQVTMNQ